jgi:NTP pyrophosphatase (non-canonical NTP hydrolase)
MGKSEEDAVFDLWKVQYHIEKFFRKMGWALWATPQIHLRLSEELGELAREVSHKYGPKKKKKGEKPSSIKEEAGDLFYTLLCLANKEGFMLGEALMETLEKYRKRDKGRTFSSGRYRGFKKE